MLKCLELRSLLPEKLCVYSQLFHVIYLHLAASGSDNASAFTAALQTKLIL